MTGSAPARGWGSRRRTAWFGCAVALGVAVWAGCTVTPENYDMLSFWFDGVYLPGSEGDTAGIRNSPDYTVHKPFAEDKCVDCHKRRFNMTAADSSVCMKCHEGVPESQPRMHGPVVTMACLWCHTPHESPYKALLKAPPREVCSQCHGPGMLGTAKTAEHGPESEVSCLECHQGHGGTVRYFLHPRGEGGMSPTPAGVAPEPTTPAESGAASTPQPGAPPPVEREPES